MSAALTWLPLVIVNASRTSVDSTRSMMSWNGVDDFSVGAIGRYVRVSCLARGTPWGYSIWELDVYAAH